MGSRERFSPKLLKAIDKAEKIACEGDRTLVIAADYGGQWDVVQATKKIAQQVLDGQCVIDDIDSDLVAGCFDLPDLPPLDLLIRTGGEKRISNFLLWQAAYAELYFSDALWPDFGREALTAAVDEYGKRQRRFGLTAEQLSSD